MNDYDWNFRQLYFLERVNCYLTMPVLLQWLSPVRCENARLRLESAWNQMDELILDGVVWWSQI